MNYILFKALYPHPQENNTGLQCVTCMSTQMHVQGGRNDRNGYFSSLPFLNSRSDLNRGIRCLFYTYYTLLVWERIKHESLLVQQSLKMQVGVTRADTTVEKVIPVPCHVWAPEVTSIVTVDVWLLHAIQPLLLWGSNVKSYTKVHPGMWELRGPTQLYIFCTSTYLSV